MGALHLLLLDSDTSSTDIRKMSKEMEQVDGVSYVLGMDSLTGSLIPDEFIPKSISSMLESDNYKLMMIGSEYATASRRSIIRSPSCRPSAKSMMTAPCSSARRPAPRI